MEQQTSSIYEPGVPFDPNSLPEDVDEERLMRERFGFDAELDMMPGDTEDEGEIYDAEEMVEDLLDSEMYDPKDDPDLSSNKKKGVLRKLTRS